MKDLNAIKELCLSAYDFLLNQAATAEVGKYDLENGAYVSVQEYETKARADTKYESHKKFIDIQMILKGQELIAVSPISKMEASDEYNPVKDVVHYKHNDQCTDFLLESGDFLILNPEDVHMPGVCVNQKSNVRKLVFKIPVKK